METISPAGRSPHPLPLSLSSLCIGGKTIFVESDPTEGRKKARSAASCIGSKQIGQDPINSWKRRGAINDANGRSARIKKAAYERRVKSFFFPPRFSPRHALGPGQIFDLSSLETRREAGV